jgi:hypothetical protein
VPRAAFDSELSASAYMLMRHAGDGPSTRTASTVSGLQPKSESVDGRNEQGRER